jgi:hypothetical protein
MLVLKKQWDSIWSPWYYIRPVLSSICGAISYIFLKAGLLVLEATQQENQNLLGFYALAFIAGLNVDKFISKLEDIAHATWGIEKSRSNSNNQEKKIACQDQQGKRKQKNRGALCQIILIIAKQLPGAGKQNPRTLTDFDRSRYNQKPRQHHRHRHLFSHGD